MVGTTASRVRSPHSDSEDDGEGDAELDEEFGPVFRLRNAVSIGAGGGRPRALTKGNAKFAAHYVSTLLKERGYVLRRGDAERILRLWLELPGDAIPRETPWRRLAEVA